MGDTLDIIMPPDYVNYVRISYVNPDTGELMELSGTKTYLLLLLICKTIMLIYYLMMMDMH
jgi:hypothetical protein